MTYYILTSKTKPGNALQRAIEQLTDAIDHRTNNNPDQFEKDLNEHILKLNAQHPRCTPVQQSSNRRHLLTDNDTDFSLYLKANGWYTYIHFHKIIGEATL